ncbi:MAG TPA: 4Fe-4S dicluster domain-containing protein [Nonomuraea sp.]|nr:4Fe-4S dicluster domain-containing protein [Nonomuraea sp.]
MSFADDAVLGTLILADMVQARESVVLCGRIGGVLGPLRESCRKYRLRLAVEHNRYPSAHPTLIADRLGRRGLASGRNPVEAGLLIVEPWTAIVIGRWFTLRRFDLARPVFFAFPAAAEPLTVRYAMPGQSLPELDPARFRHAADILIGDPMTGRRITADAPLPPDSQLVTCLPPTHPPPVQPCINCGWCVEVCPTGLDPVRMMRAAGHGLSDRWLARELPWCVECGLCSYVCPSALPVTQVLIAAKLMGRSADGSR